MEYMSAHTTNYNFIFSFCYFGSPFHFSQHIAKAGLTQSTQEYCIITRTSALNFQAFTSPPLIPVGMDVSISTKVALWQAKDERA